MYSKERVCQGFDGWWCGFRLKSISDIVPAASKMMFASKVVKSDLKIINSLLNSESMTYSIELVNVDLFLTIKTNVV